MDRSQSVCRRNRLAISGGARGYPDRGSSFPDRGAEVSAGITLPFNPPPLFRRTTYTVRSRHN